FLGAISEQFASPQGTPRTRPRPRPSTGRVVSGLGGVRPVWLSHVSTVSNQRAVQLPTRRLTTLMPKLRRQTVGRLGQRADPAGSDTGQSGIMHACYGGMPTPAERPGPSMASPP